MPEYLQPGVYIEEVSYRAHSIEGVPTSTAGFIGEAVDGPVGEPVLISSLVEFERSFGALDGRFDLGYAVRQFFDNGGVRAWVARAESDDELGVALAGFQELDPPANLLCLPGCDDEDRLRKALALCDRLRAFLIIDPPGPDVDGVIALVGRLAESGSANAGVYFPPVVVTDPATGAPRTCPPCGTVAGVLVRTDIEQGVWKPPSNAAVAGVVQLEVDVSEADAARLNDSGVNALRSFPGMGIRVWGSRTVAGSSPEWKYANVRRLALFIESSLDRGLQWAVFEPNDEPLWIEVRRSVRDFLFDLWRSGGLQGSAEDEAFFVHCDRTVMTQEDLENGRLVALIGIAPIRPAEFVILRVTIQTAPSDE